MLCRAGRLKPESVIVQPLKHKDTKKGNRFAIYKENLPESKHIYNYMGNSPIFYDLCLSVLVAVILPESVFLFDSNRPKGSIPMIEVTRLDNSKIMLNVEMIQSLQSAPDTVITFANKVRMMVKEPMEEVSKKIVEYQRLVHDNSAVEAACIENFPGTIN